MKSNIEKNLKRFLKKKIKFTTEIIILFLMIGSRAFSDENGGSLTAGTYEEFLNHGTNNGNGKIWASENKEYIYNFNKGAFIDGSNISAIPGIILNNEKGSLKINIGNNENKSHDFVVKNINGCSILVSEYGSNTEINGGNIEFINGSTNGEEDAVIYAYNNGKIKIVSETLTINTPENKNGSPAIHNSYDSKIDITLKGDFIVNSSSGILAQQDYSNGEKLTETIISSGGNIKINSTFLEDESISAKQGTGLYLISFDSENGAEQKLKTNLSAGGNLEIISKSYGLYSYGNSETSLTAKGDITVSSEKKYGIYSNSYTDDRKNINTISSENKVSISGVYGTYISGKNAETNISGNSIDITGNSFSVVSMTGGKNNLTGNLININGNTGLYSSGENSSITIKKSNNVQETFNDDEDIAEGVLITSDTTGVNSISNGLVDINHDFVQIKAGQDGISTGLDGETKITSNSVTVNSNERALSAADRSNIKKAELTAGNGGNINITATESINIYGNGTSDGTKKEEVDKNITDEQKLDVHAVVFGYNGEINLTAKNINITSYNNIYGDWKEETGKEYAAVQARGGSKINLDGTVNVSSKDGIALYAVNLRKEENIPVINNEDEEKKYSSEIILSDKGNHVILGDVLAGKNSLVDIKGSGNTLMSADGGKEIEVMAANGGTVNLNLTGTKDKAGSFTGRIDDYYEANEKSQEQGDSLLDDKVFRNDKFYLDITEGGTVNLTMNKYSVWNTVGQNYVTNVNMGDGATINMGSEKGNSVHIKNLKGDKGTFNMYLNSAVINAVKSEEAGKEAELVDSDMLYIQNVENSNAQFDLNIIGNDVLTYLNAGDRLRFATIGGENSKNISFSKPILTGRGVRNVELEVGHEEYSKDEDKKITENKNYNGDSTTELKPGNDLIDSVFGGNSTATLEEDSSNSANTGTGENYYIIKKEEVKPDEEPDTDIGKNIVSMAKANYNSAVYMDNLNKRLGDMSFANGFDGVWVRMRNDRVGEDDVYRLHNYMTQAGYDKAYPMKNGMEHRGIAFEYSRGSMDYKEISGESSVDKYLISFYDTRLYNNGMYSDFIIKGGKMYSGFDIYADTNVNGYDEKIKVSGDYDNLILSASAELGRRFDFDGSYYFEPQIQLQYTYIDDADYTTTQNTKVDYSDINSLIGRAGFRLGKDFYKENSKDNTIYLKADINHEFLGEQDVRATDITGTLDKTYHNDKSWFDVGVGGAKNITEDLNVYADIEKQFGEAKDNSWQFNLGFRYSFNDLKDITISMSSLFDFDKSDVKPQGKALIKEASEKLNNKKLKGTLNIEGHTDWTGTREYNQKLSEKRAEAVAEEFKKNVTNEKINYITKGYGKDKPIADNYTKEGRAKNRRVEVKYTKEK